MTDNNTPDFKFFAFISYNSKDIKWGKRLLRMLEYYRLPAKLCSERGWKRRHMRPIFFAPTGVRPGFLPPELQKHLNASRHLIVIGSPNSAASDWVGKEINYFHQLGRDENIHYFIVDGIPNSGDSATECYNPEIKKIAEIKKYGHSDFLGCNIHEKIYPWPWLNRERAYVQIISKMLGLDFDYLWNRHKRILIEKAVDWCIGIIAVLVAMLLIWKNNQPFDTTVRLEEATVHNPNLPPLNDAVISIQLDSETKTDTIFQEGQVMKLVNIPQKYLGKDVRFTFSCRDFISMDTMVTLTRNVTLKVSRDAAVYGNIRTELYDFSADQPVAGAVVYIDQWTTKSDRHGIVTFTVPLERQKTEYTVKVPEYNVVQAITMPTNSYKTVGIGRR